MKSLSLSSACLLWRKDEIYKFKKVFIDKAPNLPVPVCMFSKLCFKVIDTKGISKLCNEDLEKCEPKLSTNPKMMKTKKWTHHYPWFGYWPMWWCMMTTYNQRAINGLAIASSLPWFVGRYRWSVGAGCRDRGPSGLGLPGWRSSEHLLRGGLTSGARKTSLCRILTDQQEKYFKL